jgi:class 3 adenylate cyclase
MPITKLIESSSARIKEIDNRRRQIESTRGRLEPEIEDMKLGEAKKFKLAVIHIDINGFKKLVQGLSQDQYLRLVSSFLTEMTQIVNDLDGMIDRYVGDQVTALFGIDHECEKCGPEDSLKCALNMMTVIKYSLNPYLKSIGLPSISCSIGIDFGDVWIAKVGIRGINQLTLVGTTVNIAAQLVEIANNDHILLGEDVYDGISQDDKKFCEERVAKDWTWQHTSSRTPYRFFWFKAHWGNYTL